MLCRLCYAEGKGKRGNTYGKDVESEHQEKKDDRK